MKKTLNLVVSLVVVAMIFSSCASNKAVSKDVAQQPQQVTETIQQAPQKVEQQVPQEIKKEDSYTVSNFIKELKELIKKYEVQTETYTISGLVGTPLDYSDKANWMKQEEKITHKVDLVYIFPTVSEESPDGSGISEYTEDYKKAAQTAYNTSVSAFEGYTNVFAPYYRQITFDKAVQCKTQEEYENFAKETVVRTDVYTALDYYFKNLNNGRPFIFAGHSQGSMIVRLILSDYMKAHPEYLKQMVAAYVIGFSITKDWLKENPQVKFAQGETDTNVIISYNTEGPDVTLPNFVVAEGAVSINPINWKLDETLATVEENKGSLDRTTVTVVKGIADAKVDTQRGVVVCTTQTNYITGDLADFFGPKSFHFYDYPFYYENIKENGKKRIDAFLKHKAK